MIFDLHNDLLTGADPDEILTRAAEYGASLHGAVLAVWTTELTDFPAPELLAKVRAAGGGKLRFAVEDMWFFRPERPEALLALSPLYCGLTWNRDNPMGGGSYGTSGLTALGKRTIAFLNSRGIAVDGAHLNARSLAEAMALSERFIVSHTFVSEVFDHPRNIPLSVAMEIVRRGGVVGLTPVRAFMGGGDADAFVRGLDMAVQAAGADGVCIATDLYGSTDFPAELGSYAGYETIAVRLSGLGYPQDAIDKIMYKNAVRFTAGERQ